MHTLLKRQLRKYLPDDLWDRPDLVAFLDSVDKSYADYEEKLNMIQRATSLSSKELFEKNQQLNKETESQRKVLEALSRAVAFMENEKAEVDTETSSFDPMKLLEDIERQTSKIIEMTAENNELVRSLEARNESLNNYAHMVSHDLKSPIRNIHSLLTWYLEDLEADLPQRGNDNFELVFQNLNKMDSLIDGILRHATIDSLEDQAVAVDLGKLIDEIRDTIYTPPHVEIIVESPLPVIVTGKYRLEQLFKNLLTNAVTATESVEKGRIVLDATERADGWTFSVTDNGKGIPEHLQAGIFNMFKKLENDSNATGIGLALVKKIVNYYDGEIWLSSEVGKGTTFFFTIKPKN